MSTWPAEVGTTIRVAIEQWPRTMRLICILTAAAAPVALTVLLLHR
jgi:hypothetical protein